MDLLRLTALVQGIYFFITGVWPLVHMPSFLKVTGPKTDLWLVRCVGALVTSIALPILLAWWDYSISAPIILLAAGSALGLMLIDMVYVARRVIARIYLLDAAIEALLLLAWAVGLLLNQTR